MSGNPNTKVKVAMLSVISNSALIVMKLIVGVLSGSVSIISEAIHSGMDLVASIIAFFSVRASSKPADKEHPYGHGKIENVSGVIEGLLIFIAAFLIIKEAIVKLIHPTEVSQTFMAIAVMGISSGINILVSRTLYKVAKKEESVALEADALHLKTDVYTSAGVALGLLLMTVTRIRILDPITAILVALLIVKEAWSLCRDAFKPLLDASLTEEEEIKIKGILETYDEKIKGYHKLRTRRSGNIKYIDFHMFVDGSLTVDEAHSLSKEIETILEQEIKNTNASIHIEPSRK
ncbi:MAG TPA: cation diffusion facilitator family transporter [Ruminiclostridium sp.]|nr:cation diffusion facilitator family transporter [Ruminiclostridium sp.]